MVPTLWRGTPTAFAVGADLIQPSENHMATALQIDFAQHLVPLKLDSAGPNGRAFGLSLIESFDRGLRNVVVDCTEWRHLDFGVLSALVKSAEFFRKRGGQFEIVNLSEGLAADIRALRLERRLGLS
jgi:anti-anti-sigma regulatory factor